MYHAERSAAFGGISLTAPASSASDMTGPASRAMRERPLPRSFAPAERIGKAMPKLTRIYTRTGDEGMTGLIGGGRVKKNAPRIETYGTIDELSSAIGIARAALRPLLPDHERARSVSTRGLRGRKTRSSISAASLRRCRKIAAKNGPRSAAPTSKHSNARSTRRKAIFRRSRTSSIPAARCRGAYLHFARTICRRAERLLVALTRS